MKKTYQLIFFLSLFLFFASTIFCSTRLNQLNQLSLLKEKNIKQKKVLIMQKHLELSQKLSLNLLDRYAKENSLVDIKGQNFSPQTPRFAKR